MTLEQLNTLPEDEALAVQERLKQLEAASARLASLPVLEPPLSPLSVAL